MQLGAGRIQGLHFKALAAFDGFKQVGIGAVGELQIDRKRRVQVGQHFADNGNVGVAFSGLLQKLGESLGQQDFLRLSIAFTR